MFYASPFNLLTPIDSRKGKCSFESNRPLELANRPLELPISTTLLRLHAKRDQRPRRSSRQHQRQRLHRRSPRSSSPSCARRFETRGASPTRSGRRRCSRRGRSNSVGSVRRRSRRHATRRHSAPPRESRFSSLYHNKLVVQSGHKRQTKAKPAIPTGERNRKREKNLPPLHCTAHTTLCTHLMHTHTPKLSFLAG